MNPALIGGVIVVNLALLSYTVATWRLWKRPFSRQSLLILSAGVAFDIIATACMIMGSPNSPFTAHGIMGYSALLAMVVDAVLLWRLWSSAPGPAIPKPLAVYSKLAYGWWVVVYVTGSVLVATAQSAAV